MPVRLIDSIGDALKDLGGLSQQAAQEAALLVVRRSNDIAIMRLTGEPGIAEAERRAVQEVRLTAVAGLQWLAAESDQRLQGAILAFLRVGASVGMAAWGGV